MTKWAEYLNDIFEEPEYHVYQRPYSFKCTDNEITHLTKENKDKLVKKIREENAEVKTKYQGLLENCYQWIGKLLSDRRQDQGYICRYSDTRTLASKINAVLTHLILNYLNLLIHHLIRAGYEI